MVLPSIETCCGRATNKFVLGHAYEPELLGSFSVPLTLGMAFLLAIMETVYVLSGKQIYKDMTKFWGKLFGINFALGVATGLTMEFQFGTNWSYYSHYVGDIFGAPLAIEGLMAFFLAAHGRHLAGCAGFQPLRAVDPCRQRLDAEPYRIGLQLRNHAYGDGQLL